MTRRKDPRSARLPVPRDQLPAFEPVPRKYLRHDGWTPERQLAFIEALADTGSVEAACRAVDMASTGVYQLRRQEGAASFREAWDAALDCGVRMLEDNVMERAIHGTEVPVLSAGQYFGTRRVYNERMAMLILQARLPEKYGLQRARTMSGLDKQTLARKKREWRREWDAEQAHKAKTQARIAAQAEYDREDEVLESINRKFETMATRLRDAMSPRTRELFEAYRASEDEDERKGHQWWLDPHNPHYEGPRPAPGEEGDDDASDPEWSARALPPPDWRARAVAQEVEAEPAGPRVRRLTDGEWK